MSEHVKVMLKHGPNTTSGLYLNLDEWPFTNIHLEPFAAVRITIPNPELDKWEVDVWPVPESIIPGRHTAEGLFEWEPPLRGTRAYVWKILVRRIGVIV